MASVLSYMHCDYLNSASPGSALRACLGIAPRGADLATDASGNKITGSDTRYTPFGQTQDGYEGTDLPTDRRYTGQREVADLGLYDYAAPRGAVARYYDPYIGRFIQADTIIPDPGSAQGYNRYSYAANNPLRYNDPTGHYPKTPVILSEPYHEPEYNPRKAVEYALEYVNTSNLAYIEAPKDCTNYASQMLVAGGMYTDERWDYNDGQATNAWWTTRVNPTTVGADGEYGELDGLYNYLTDENGLGLSHTVYGEEESTIAYQTEASFPGTSKIRPGDVLFYVQGGEWKHAAIVLGWGPQNPEDLDESLRLNPDSYANYNKNGQLTPWVAEHSGGYHENPRPVQYTSTLVNQIYIVHIPQYFGLYEN